ncbi:MAG: HAMP domain-containing sensor histidine kinase [Candidatus Limnocylindrales bacterium]
MTIRARLAATYAVGLVITVAVVGALVWWQMDGALRASLGMTIQTRADAVLTAVENAGQSGLQNTDQAAPGVFAALFSPAGVRLDASADTPPGIRPVAGIQQLGGRQYLVLTTVAQDGTIIVTGADLRSISDAEAALTRVLLGAGAATGAASVLVAWLLARRALRPIDRLIESAASLGPDNLQRRLDAPDRADEVGQLTVTLNGMLDRIAESVERQRLFVAMASHELRTPLASLRVELDLVDRDDATPAELRDALRQARGDAIRLSGLSTSLLELAAVGVDARALVLAPVRVNELLLGVVRGLDGLARQRSVEVTVDAPDVVARVDRTRIEHAVGNLIANAIVHGGGGGSVEVHCRIEPAAIARSLIVEVLDRGPGVGSAPTSALFEPFQQGARGRHRGAGLGLATVASAITAHGGTFGAANRDGGGARFWFAVPFSDGDRPVPDPVPEAAPGPAPRSTPR